jgi:hypothetical protein
LLLGPSSHEPSVLTTVELTIRDVPCSVVPWNQPFGGIVIRSGRRTAIAWLVLGVVAAGPSGCRRGGCHFSPIKANCSKPFKPEPPSLVPTSPTLLDAGQTRTVTVGASVKVLAYTTPRNCNARVLRFVGRADPASSVTTFVAVAPERTLVVADGSKVSSNCRVADVGPFQAEVVVVVK